MTSALHDITTTSYRISSLPREHPATIYMTIYIATSNIADSPPPVGTPRPSFPRSILLRIEAADPRYAKRGKLRVGAQLVLPYFVPRFADDDAITPSSKLHSVCFFGTATNPLRRRAITALRHAPHSRFQLGRHRDFNGSRSALVAERLRTVSSRQVHTVTYRVAERIRTISSRQELRRCKFCLVPAGITPSSRRYYEALVAK